MAIKRKASEWIDLTKSSDEEDAIRAPKLPRVSRSMPLQIVRDTNTRDGFAVQNIEDTDEFIDSSQDPEIGRGEGFELYGNLLTKVVGIRFYRGCATQGEVVMLCREPQNQYDTNALRVDNVQRKQIGHIPRQVAAKLSTYLDEGSVFLIGRLAGAPGEYECPISIEIYGTDDLLGSDALQKRLKRDGLPIDSIIKNQKTVRARNMEQLEAARKVASATPGSSQQWQYGNSQSQRPGPLSQSLLPARMEDLVAESTQFSPREVGRVVEKFGIGEEFLAQMPMAEAPARLSTKMLPYQRQALAWMLEKERPLLPPPGSQDIVQLWKRSDRSPKMFTHIATNFTLKDTEPTLARGGILADDMGLGKTLEVISLILADLAAGSPKSPKESMATLIVAPVSVMSNWTTQVSCPLLTSC